MNRTVSASSLLSNDPSRPKPISSFSKRKWDGDADTTAAVPKPNLDRDQDQLGSDEWPTSPKKPKPAGLNPGFSTSVSSRPTKTGSATTSTATDNKPSTVSAFFKPVSRAPIASSSKTNNARPANNPTLHFNTGGSRPWDLSRITEPDMGQYTAGSASRTALSAYDNLTGPAGSKLASTSKGSSGLMSTSANIKQKLLLSPEQRKVLELAVDKGQNIFFTGSAGASLLSRLAVMTTDHLVRIGTGKSVLLREIIAALRRKAKTADSVVVTASTAMAACNIGGTTIHSFAGIGLGKDTAEMLISKVKTGRGAAAKWQRADVLVIDESA